MVFGTIGIYVITSTFLRFYVFKKNMTFTFFAVFRTFSRTMPRNFTDRKMPDLKYDL